MLFEPFRKIGWRASLKRTKVWVDDFVSLPLGVKTERQLRSHLERISSRAFIERCPALATICVSDWTGEVEGNLKFRSLCGWYVGVAGLVINLHRSPLTLPAFHFKCYYPVLRKTLVARLPQESLSESEVKDLIYEDFYLCRLAQLLWVSEGRATRLSLIDQPNLILESFKPFWYDIEKEWLEDCKGHPSSIFNMKEGLPKCCTLSRLSLEL